MEEQSHIEQVYLWHLHIVGEVQLIAVHHEGADHVLALDVVDDPEGNVDRADEGEGAVKPSGEPAVQHSETVGKHDSEVGDHASPTAT